MGFSIPSLSLPKLPELNINSAIGKLTATFNPAGMVGAVEGNVMAQLGALESMREQLESLRKQAQQAVAATDFQALSDYTAGMQQMTDVSAIMASAKPSFTPMTPDSLSNPLASGSDAGGLVSEALGAYLGVDPAVVDAVASGDVETLTSPDTLSDLAIAGAGAYVSGMTGGAIPPDVAAGVIDSVAGDAINSTIAGAMSGDVSSIANIDMTKSLTGTDALNVATAAIGADPTGGLLEGALTQTTSGVINQISDKALTNLSSADLNNIATKAISSVGATGYGSDIGGMNLNDPSSIAQSVAVAGLERASTSGNVTTTTNMLDILIDAGHSASMFVDQVKNLGDTLENDPRTMSLYTELYDTYVPKNVSDTVLETGSTVQAVVKVFDTLAEQPSVYNSKVAEQMYGKDEARKRKTLMDIAASKRAATSTAISTAKRYMPT